MKKTGRAFVFPALACLFLLLIGCAHKPSTVYGRDEAGLPAPTPGAVREVPAFRLNDPEPPAVADEELDQIPVEINSKVEQWISYFQRRGRPHMERYLARSTRYGTLMKRILRQNGLPEDLLYIALIESGFSSKATSRAAAVGYWQFIRGTGRRYGLEINSLIDERRDPVLSTQAAADYFKGLYSVFGSWYLAMASYNVGENRVMREVMRNRTRDFWELARKRRLPRETVNYVPKYIAAKLIAKNPEKYGFTDIEYEDPIEFELVTVNKPVNLRVMAENMGMDYAELKQLNPKFRGEVAPLKGDLLELRVPLQYKEQALAAATAAAVDKVEYIADAGETITYRVRRGDSLYLIARRFRTTVAWLRDVNDLKRNRVLRIGMRLQVPDRSARRSTVASRRPPAAAKKVASNLSADRAQATAKAEIETKQGTYYIVQAGDTLSGIAEEYDSTVKQLLRMNRMRRGQILRIGMKIKVPKDVPLPSEPGVDTVNGNVQEAPQGEREPGTNDESRPDSQLRAKTQSRWTARARRRAQRAAESRARGKASSPSRRRVAAAPKTRVHVVKKGENLSAISARYGVPVSRIKAKNRLRNSNRIMAGKRLVIPIAKNDVDQR